MYYVLFRYKKGRCEKDYQGFRTEEALSLFLMEKGLEIHIDKIIESLAELKFGLINVLDTMREKTEKEETEEFKAAEKEFDQEIKDAEIIRKNKKALKKADKAIAAAANERADKKANWKVCPQCKVNKVAPWNKKGICSSCQKPPGKRKYTLRKRAEEMGPDMSLDEKK